MPFSLSGHVAEGASEALNKVLARRMEEHARRIAEQQHAEEVQMRRQTIDLQRRGMEEASAERAANARIREEDRAAKIGEGVAAEVGFGDVTPEQGALIEKSPVEAARLRKFDRPIIDARPIQGTTPLDASGPQSLPVVRLEPTAAQAKQQRLEDERARILGKLPKATQSQRRDIAAEAAAAGVTDIPNRLFEPTTEEQIAQKRADDLAAEERWGRQNAVTFGQQQSLHNQSEAAAAARARESEAAAERRAQAAADRAKPDPAAQAQARDEALKLARELKSHPGLSSMTGFRGAAYGYGYRDEPFSGSQAATAKKLLDSLQALLTIPNLSYLKGPMSDKDILFIKAASTALDSQMRDKDFIAKLDDVINRLENPTGEGWRDKPGRSPAGGTLAPGTTVTIGSDNVVEVELDPRTGQYVPKKKSQ